MKLFIAAMLLAGCIVASAFALEHPRDRAEGSLGPYSAAVNIAEDLGAPADSAPTEWGTGQSYASRIQFNAPAGYRTRVLRVYGDVIAFSKSGTIAAGTSAEIGWGLKTTAPDGSTRVTYPGYTASAYDNSFVWLQDSLSVAATSQRLPFDLKTDAGGLLAADNVLISQAFVALNTTGAAIHIEPTFVVVYRFEKI